MPLQFHCFPLLSVLAQGHMEGTVLKFIISWALVAHTFNTQETEAGESSLSFLVMLNVLAC